MCEMHLQKERAENLWREVCCVYTSPLATLRMPLVVGETSQRWTRETPDMAADSRCLNENKHERPHKHACVTVKLM